MQVDIPCRKCGGELERDLSHGVARQLFEARLREMGKDVSFTVYAGTGHAFMAPHNALGTQDMAAYEEAWPRAVGFLHEHLD